MPEKTPKWKAIRHVPPLQIPTMILNEPDAANRLKPTLKTIKSSIGLQNSDKSSYQILLLIRELALSQEREEALNACISKVKEEYSRISSDFTRTREEIDSLQKCEKSLRDQLRESAGIITHYEHKISEFQVIPPVEKSSIGVGTDLIV